MKDIAGGIVQTEIMWSCLTLEKEQTCPLYYKWNILPVDDSKIYLVKMKKSYHHTTFPLTYLDAFLR